MKDVKLLLAGLILLLFAIFVGVFLWLWNNNSKALNPLPIMSHESANSGTAVGVNLDDDESDTAIDVLNIRADETLQIPLDDIIVKFESRYPKVQILTRYVPAKSLLALPDADAPTKTVSVKNVAENVSGNEPLPSVANIDIVIADNNLSQDQLAPLQKLLNDQQTKLNQSQINASNNMANNEEDKAENTNDMANQDNNKARNLTTFGYALKDEQVVDGVILTNNPIALTFRNFILSSDGQDILKQYDYHNIDGYKNNMDDLFNGASSANKEVEVSNILGNSE